MSAFVDSNNPLVAKFPKHYLWHSQAKNLESLVYASGERSGELQELDGKFVKIITKRRCWFEIGGTMFSLERGTHFLPFQLAIFHQVWFKPDGYNPRSQLDEAQVVTLRALLDDCPRDVVIETCYLEPATIERLEPLRYVHLLVSPLREIYPLYPPEQWFMDCAVFHQGYCSTLFMANHLWKDEKHDGLELYVAETQKKATEFVQHLNDLENRGFILPLKWNGKICTKAEIIAIRDLRDHHTTQTP